MVDRASRLAAWLLVLLLPVPSLAGQASGDWDPTAPRGRTRVIDFTTDEGTWMSVDLSPDGQWIVFDLLGHVYRVSARGGRAESLTQGSGIAVNYHPRYSPDGRQIAFVSDRRGQDNLWIMDADGGRPRPLLLDENSRAAEPAWTPDGRSVLFTRRMKSPSGFYRTNDEMWRVPVAGGEPTLVVRLQASGTSTPARAGVWAGEDRVQWPSPTPDGRYVYFHSSLFAGTGRQLKRIELASGRIDDVTESSARYLTCCGRPAYPLRLGEVAPEVSPDGRWLAFARKIPGARTAVGGQTYVGRTALWLRDLETGVERVVMDPISNDQMDEHPAWEHRVLPGYSWARDGKSIVLTQGGKLRRVWIETGRVETIPFEAPVHRIISEMARSRVTIDDQAFQPRFPRWPAASPDGRSLVFEAVGRLWLKPLPAGMPRPLTTAGNERFELTPAWSPDGRWIVFATWSDEQGGAVWRVAAGGGAAERITPTAGRYLHPAWTGDGAAVVVNRWDPALTYTPDGPGWRVVRLPIGGGEPTVLREAGGLARSAFDRSGRVYRVRGDRLVATRAGGGDVWTHPAIAGAAALVAPSPDGRWAAMQLKHDVYLAPLPAGADSIAVDLSAANPAMRRLTIEGGEYPRWRSATVVEMVSADRYLAHDVTTGRTDTIPLGLSIPRDHAGGTVALTGARIITMDRRRVVERGTILVTDGRITCVGECDPSGADQRFDLTGRTVMPGLIDVHAHHLTEEQDGLIPEHRPASARYLAWGVTTVHDPAATMEPGFPVAEMIEAGRIVGPRTFSTGVPLTCSDFDDLREIDSYEDAREHLVREVNYGAISIKDYKQCTRIQRQMLAEAARRAPVTLTSEGSDLIYLLGLIMNGSTGWEHPLQEHPIYRDVAQFFGQAGATYSAQLFISDYPHGDAIEYWLGREDLWRNRKLLAWTPWEEIATRRSFVKKPLEEYILPIAAQGAAQIKRAGGYLAVGAHGEMDGLGTHWELWSYALGLTPMEALEAGTIDGARFLGLEGETGSIVPGKLADLVVLGSNPLDDIHHTEDVVSVMKAGRLYDASTLDELWPRRRPYGGRWWNPEAMLREDVRADDYWDHRP